MTRGSTAFDNLTAFRDLSFLRSRHSTFEPRWKSSALNHSQDERTDSRAPAKGRFNDKRKCLTIISTGRSAGHEVTRCVFIDQGKPSRSGQLHLADPRGARAREISVHRLEIDRAAVVLLRLI